VPNVLQNIGDIWRRTSLSNRILLVGVLLACAGATVVLVMWATRPNLVVLCSGVTPEESAKIVDKITAQDVPFKVTDGGRTVLVPEDRKNALLMTLAGEGLPGETSPGYSILDEERIGTSPFAQRVNYARAVEGELARTIQTLENVSSARVHVVRPENALFTAEGKEASATVVLRLKGSFSLNGGQVASIIHLVAGAVEGLKPDNVVVVDTQGRLLSGEASNELAGKAGTFHDYRSRVEHDLARKAEEMLATAIGPGRASVRVSVKMKATAESTSKETLDPVGKVLVSEMIQTKSVTPAEGSSDGKTSEETTDTKYEVGKIVERKDEMPGQILSKSVAVLVDLTPRKDGEGNEIKAMTKEDVESLVRSALGLKLTSEEGGTDDLSVVPTQFAAAQTGEGPPEDGGMFTTGFLLDLARRMSLGLLVVGALLALKLFGGKKRSKGAEEAAAITAGVPAGALPEGAQSGNLLPAPVSSAEQARLRDRITRALQDNPEEVRRLFLNWAESGEGGQ